MTRARPLVLVAALALVAGVPASREARAAAPRCEHVVLVILGGGVRAREMLGREDLMPTVAAIGRAGFASSGWAAAGADHASAVEGLLTGRHVPVRTRESARPAFPTLLEEARKGLALGPDDAWFACYADGDALGAAASGREGYERAAPRLAYGEGPFGEPMRPLLARFGRPNPTSARAWTLLESLRASSRAGSGAKPGAGAEAGTSAEDARLERALLEEVDRRAVAYSGPNGLDVRAVRAAITAWRVFRPRLLVVRLGQADVAHRSAADYLEVLRRDDAEIARLRAEIRADAVLADRTALLVLPEIGRDRAPNAAGGYDHDDGSPDATTVAVVGEGAGLRRGASPAGRLDVFDVAPTVARLLGFAMPFAEGTARDDLLAPAR